MLLACLYSLVALHLPERAEGRGKEWMSVDEFGFDKDTPKASQTKGTKIIRKRRGYKREREGRGGGGRGGRHREREKETRCHTRLIFERGMSAIQTRFNFKTCNFVGPIRHDCILVPSHRMRQLLLPTFSSVTTSSAGSLQRLLMIAVAWLPDGARFESAPAHHFLFKCCGLWALTMGFAHRFASSSID